MNKMTEQGLKNALGKNYVFKLIKKFTPYKKAIAWCIIFIVVGIVLGIVTPMVNSYLVDNVIPNRQVLTFYWVVAGIAALEALNVISTFIKSHIINKFAYGIIAQIRNDLYTKLTMFDMDYYNHNTTGSLLAKSTTFVDNIAVFYTSHIFTLIENALRLAIFIPFMLVASPMLSIMALSAVVPIFIGLYVISKLQSKRSKHYYKVQSKTFENVVEKIKGIDTILAFNNEEQSLKSYENQVDSQYKELYKLNKVNHSYNLILDTIYNAFVAGMYVLAFILIAANQIDFAIYVAFIGYQASYWSAFNSTIQLFNGVTSLAGNFQQVFNTLEDDEKITDSSIAKAHDLKGNITIKNLTFSYGERVVIDNLSMYVKVGQKLTLCGLSNSGKSTLVEIVGRLYHFDHGKILFDEFDVNELKLSSLHKNIGVVQQNPFMFNGSFLDNIRFGNKKASLNTCMEACKLIGAHEFIESYGGYNKIVTRDLLTDGEKQLINIARLIVHNPKVILYDEALNKLTTKQEYDTLKILTDHFKNNTMLVVSNNHLVIENSEYIYYLKNGVINQHGTYEKLMSTETDFKIDMY